LRRIPPWIAVGAIVFLALLCANVWLAPGNDRMWSTLERSDVAVVAGAITVGYVLASIGVIALFGHTARERSSTPDVRKDVRDGAWQIAILSAGSLGPMVIAALMRTDSGVPGTAGASGPVVSEIIILMIAISAIVLASVLTIASSVTRSTSATR
jgi:hypothetical protein